MGNPDKTKPYRFQKGEERAKEYGRRGGIQHGVNQAKRRSMADITATLLNSKLDDGNKEKMKKMCADLADEDATMATLLVAGQFQAAMKGNTKAFEALNELNEKACAQNDNEKYELPARVLGSAFVDINRHIEPNKTYVFEGGRGGLKSSYIGFKVVELIKNYPNLHACVVRKVGNTLKDSVYAQIKWCINQLHLDAEFDFKTSPLEIRYKKTGQIIYFRGADDPLKLKSIKPPFGYIGILWKEEKDQLKGAEEERSINQSVLRGGDIAFDFSSYNPPKSKQSWVNKEKLIPDPNRVIHECNYTQAPPEWLGQKFIDDAEHLKEVNPAAYEHEYMGVPNGEGGSVFEYLEIREITDAEIATFDRIYQGVDWGWYPDLYVFKRVYVDEAHKKIYHIAEHVGNKMKNSDTAQWIIDHDYNDFRITCDSAEPKSVNDYRDAGLPAVPAIKGPGSVEYGMKFLQGYTHVIDPKRTPVTLKEFKNYEYERDKEGNVISGYPDRDNHTIDTTRYATECLYNSRGTSA